MKKSMMIAGMIALFSPTIALAVTAEEDVATTIKLRGYDCPGRSVTTMEKQQHADGSTQIDATCSNGVRYRITVDANGHLMVRLR
ncbi:MAG: hypothetical protein R8J84_03700 [Mariprofundales bacterium]